jgi:hypothetical protein
MPTEIIYDYWTHFYSNSQNHDRYKLHFSIDPRDFSRVQQSLNDLLENAVLCGAAQYYKVYRVEQFLNPDECYPYLVKDLQAHP